MVFAFWPPAALCGFIIDEAAKAHDDICSGNLAVTDRLHRLGHRCARLELKGSASCRFEAQPEKRREREALENMRADISAP